MHKVTKVIFQQRTQNIIFNMKMASLFLIKCQFENPEDSKDSEDLRSLGDVLDGILGREKVEEDRDKEGKDSKEVNNIEE